MLLLSWYLSGSKQPEAYICPLVDVKTFLSISVVALQSNRNYIAFKAVEKVTPDSVTVQLPPL